MVRLRQGALHPRQYFCNTDLFQIRLSKQCLREGYRKGWKSVVFCPLLCTLPFYMSTLQTWSQDLVFTKGIQTFAYIQKNNVISSNIQVNVIKSIFEYLGLHIGTHNHCVLIVLFIGGNTIFLYLRLVLALSWLIPTRFSDKDWKNNYQCLPIYFLYKQAPNVRHRNSSDRFQDKFVK